MITSSSIEVNKDVVPFTTDSGQTSNVRENAKLTSNKNRTSLNESKIKDRKELKSSVVRENKLRV